MLKIVVYGRAEPSGSKTRTRYGVREDNKRAAGYRLNVAAAAAEAMGSLGLDVIPRQVPLAVDVTIYRLRPSGHWLRPGALSASGRRSPRPTTRPDRGKLLRTIEDALTGVVYEDDAQVVDGYVRKCWADDGSPERVEILVSVCDPEAR